MYKEMIKSCAKFVITTLIVYNTERNETGLMARVESEKPIMPVIIIAITSSVMT